MPDNRTTDSESPPLDFEDWQIVFRAYVKFPDLAFILAQHLHGASKLIEQGPETALEALAGLERAVECPDALHALSQYRSQGLHAGSRGQSFD